MSDLLSDADVGIVPQPVLSDADVGLAAHPVAGPSGDFWKDLKTRAGSAGTDALAGYLALPRTVAQGVDWLGKQVGVNPGASDAVGSIKDPSGSGAPLFPDYGTARNMAYNTTGATEYQPETWGGRIGQAALTAAISGGPKPSAIPAMAAGGGTAEAASELVPHHPVLAGMAGFALGAKGARMAANAAIPAAGGTLPAEDAGLAREAQNRGIPLAAPQVSTSPSAKFIYSQTGKMPLSGAGEFAEHQQRAFNGAVANTFGETAQRITPDVIQAARQRIGGVFNDVANRTSVPMDNQLMQGLQDVVDRARMTMSADSVAPVERQAMNVVNTAANNSGNIGGRAYLDLTQRGGPLDNMIQSADPGIRQAGMQLRNEVDSALQRNAAPEDVTRLMQARAQWKALKTVEPLTLRADSATGGATPSTGDISPASLRGAVNKSYQNAASGGGGDLDTLARIGQRFLKEPPSSGTSERTLVNHGMEAAGALGMGVMGHEMGLPLMAAVAAPAAAVGASRAVQSIMRNPYLANRAIAASLNPGGFQFTGPMGAAPAALPLLGQPPFGWGATAIPATTQSR